MSVSAVVVAAGHGVRFGGPKQFASLHDETVTAHSVRAARSVADTVVVVVPSGYDGDGEGADIVVTGGASRSASVRAGLQHCGDADIVVVHDAARPLASSALFHAVVDAVRAGADAAIPGLAVIDTVKRVATSDGVTYVVGTVARDQLVTVQTPQAFGRVVLERAHAQGVDATDDAGLVEMSGGRVVVVSGESSNIKITHPDDIDTLLVFEARRP